MKGLEYNFKNKTIKAEPNFARYLSTGNLYFYIKVYEEDSMPRTISITENYNKKLPYLHGVVSGSDINSNIDFLTNYNLAEPTGETFEFDKEKCYVFKFNEDVLKKLNPEMFKNYRKYFQ